MELLLLLFTPVGHHSLVDHALVTYAEPTRGAEPDLFGAVELFLAVGVFTAPSVKERLHVVVNQRGVDVIEDVASRRVHRVVLPHQALSD